MGFTIRLVHVVPAVMLVTHRGDVFPHRLLDQLPPNTHLRAKRVKAVTQNLFHKPVS